MACDVNVGLGEFLGAGTRDDNALAGRPGGTGAGAADDMVHGGNDTRISCGAVQEEQAIVFSLSSIFVLSFLHRKKISGG